MAEFMTAPARSRMGGVNPTWRGGQIRAKIRWYPRGTCGQGSRASRYKTIEIMNSPLRILVAEDDVGDVMLLQRAFAKAAVNPPVYFACDGKEVMDYLEGNPPFDNPVQYPLPNLLLLDLALPVVNGFEVLTWLRQHPTLHQMLVMVLSSSDDPLEIERAYVLGANSYFIKPREPARLVEVIKRVQQYWQGIAVQPEEALIAI